MSHPDSIFSRVQKPQERARDYEAVIQKLARHFWKADISICSKVIKGSQNFEIGSRDPKPRPF